MRWGRYASWHAETEDCGTARTADCRYRDYPGRESGPGAESVRAAVAGSRQIIREDTAVEGQGRTYPAVARRLRDQGHNSDMHLQQWHDAGGDAHHIHLPQARSSVARVL